MNTGPSQKISATSLRMLLAAGLFLPPVLASAQAVNPSVIAVSAGYTYNMFVTDDGILWAMGRNGSGQFGDGTFNYNPTKNPEPVADKIDAAAAGGYHSLQVTRRGLLRAAGLNDSGQLGDGTDITRSTPVSVAAYVTTVAAGSGHSLYLTDDGILWAMGNNYSGQLGDGTTTDRSTPVPVATDAIAVAAGDFHSLYLTDDGTLWAMGRNNYGQLGNGTTISQSTPVKIATHVIAMSAGYDHSLYVTDDGILWGMGTNGYGQLSGANTGKQHNTPVPVAADVAFAAAGFACSFYVTRDGTLWALGKNDAGQLGDGTTTNRSAPVPIATNVTSVAARDCHSLYATGNGNVWAMGLNNYGQLGDGTTTERHTPVLVFNAGELNPSGAPMIATQPASRTVSAGHSAAFTISATGNPFPTLQWQSTSDGLTWTNIPGAPTATLTLNTVTTTMNGTLYRCVATNSQGTDTSNAATLTVNASDSGGTGGGGGGGGGAPSLLWLAATAVLLALRKNFQRAVKYRRLPSLLTARSAAQTSRLGSLRYSHSRQQQPTRAMTTHNNTPTAPNPATAAIAALRRLLAKTAPTFAFAAGLFAILSSSPAFSVRAASPAPTLVTPAAGAYHSLYVTADGQLWSMGLNHYGQLGLGYVTEYVDQITPQAVPGATNVIAVAAGHGHSLYVAGDGQLWAFGDNSAGQLGQGYKDDIPHPSPLKVPSATNVIAVAAGNAHSLYVTGDGQLWAFGYNAFGELGIGEYTFRGSPVKVPGATNVIAMAGGADHTLYVTADGQLWAMGLNIDGQLGLGYNNPIDRNTPRQVPGATNVIAVAAGSEHSLYLTSDGQLWAFGRNNLGQLGLGNTTDQLSPVKVPGATNVIAVAAGSCHSLYVTADGQLWTMGWNNFGQLGQGFSSPPYQPQPTPVKVSGATNVIALAVADGEHNLYLTGDGELWGMGRNNEGELGLDNTLHQYSPVLIDILDFGVGGPFAPPAIIAQPATQTVIEGQNVTFTVLATGERLVYQWMKNGVAIGAGSARCTITNVQQSDAGTYSVRVSNPAGSVTSEGATLTVNRNPDSDTSSGGGGGGGGGGGAPSLLWLGAGIALLALRARKTR